MQPKGTILELCQVVGDMDKALDHWTRVIGAGPFFVFDVPVLPGQKYRGQPTEVAMRVGFGFSGGLLIELLQQTNDTKSVFSEILEKNGDGYHHIMPRIDFDEGSAKLTAEGYEVAFSGQMPSGERFCLFDTRSGNGGFIELMEISPAMEGAMQLMHKAHVQWDGTTKPIRSMEELAEYA